MSSPTLKPHLRGATPCPCADRRRGWSTRGTRRGTIHFTRPVSVTPESSPRGRMGRRVSPTASTRETQDPRHGHLRREDHPGPPRRPVRRLEVVLRPPHTLGQVHGPPLLRLRPRPHGPCRPPPAPRRRRRRPPVPVGLLPVVVVHPGCGRTGPVSVSVPSVATEAPPGTSPSEEFPIRLTPLSSLLSQTRHPRRTRVRTSVLHRTSHPSGTSYVSTPTPTWLLSTEGCPDSEMFLGMVESFVRVPATLRPNPPRSFLSLLGLCPILFTLTQSQCISSTSTFCVASGV